MMLQLKFFLFVFVCLASCYNAGCEKRPARVDLCVIVDTNGDRRTFLTDAKKAISSLIDTLSISSSTTRLMLITVASKVRLRIELSSCTNRECLKAKLKRIRQSSGHFRYHHVPQMTKLALTQASNLLEKTGHPDAMKYILLMSESRPNHKMTAFLREQIAAKNVTVVTSQLRHHRGGIVSAKYGLLFHKGIVYHSRNPFPFTKAAYTKCKKPGKVLDECNRRCDCKGGRIVNCERVRKEFTEMSLDERRRFISAFKTLASNPIYKKRYETYAKIHVKHFFKGIHTEDYFLPWHRWYMLAFENMIREVDCRVTIPYWDWAFWSNVSWKNNIHIWNSHDYGLGGNGDPEKGYCVQDGPFKEGSFKTPEFDNEAMVLDAIAYATDKPVMNITDTPNKGGCLRRSFNGKPVGVPEIKKILRHRAGSFAIFENLVRLSLHNSMHNEIGGHMCSTFASVAPEFYLHHTFLDKLWHAWQQHSKACLKAKFSNARTKMSKFDCQYSQSDLIDSRKLPGHVNIAYTDYYYRFENKGSHKASQGDLKEQTDIIMSDALYGNKLFLKKLTAGDKRINDLERSSNDEQQYIYDANWPIDSYESKGDEFLQAGEKRESDRNSEDSMESELEEAKTEQEEGREMLYRRTGRGPFPQKNPLKIYEEEDDDKDCVRRNKQTALSHFMPPYEKICYKNYINRIIGKLS